MAQYCFRNIHMLEELHGDGQITQEEMKALMILCGGREVTRVPTAISKKPRAGLASVTVPNPPL